MKKSETVADYSNVPREQIKLTKFSPKIFILYLLIYFAPILVDWTALPYMGALRLQYTFKACLSPVFIVSISGALAFVFGWYFSQTKKITF